MFLDDPFASFDQPGEVAGLEIQSKPQSILLLDEANEGDFVIAAEGSFLEEGI